MTTHLTAQLKQSSDVGWDRNERIVRAYAIEKSDLLPIVIYTIIFTNTSLYKNIQIYHLDVKGVLCESTKRTSDKRRDVFLDKAIRWRSCKIYAHLRFQIHFLSLMYKSILLMFFWIRKTVSRGKKSARMHSRSAKDTRCQIVTRLFDTEKGDIHERKHFITTPPFSRTSTMMRTRLRLSRAVKHAKD